MKVTNKDLSYEKMAVKMIYHFKKFSKDTLVAGGFARDYILKRDYGIDTEIKDIDLYVKYTKGAEKELLKLQSKGMCKEMTSQYKGLNRLKGVYKFEMFQNKDDGLFTENYTMDVQVILVDCDSDLENYVKNHFDLSICMATFDGVDFKEFPEFTETMKTKKITFNEDLGKDETAYAFKKHVAKLTCRFSRLGFKYDGYNPKFVGSRYRCKLINRTRLSDKMMEEGKWQYRTKKYYYYDDEAGSYAWS